MSEIFPFEFNKDKFDQIKKHRFGNDWPVVYLINNEDEIYIGQTINAYSRCKQHYDNPDRRRLKDFHIISDGEYNISAALDIESSLIEYMFGDNKFTLQNGNKGLQNHNYFDREKYKAKFEIIWDKLKKLSLVKNDLSDIKNSDLFKYSPYKTLSTDQIDVVEDLYRNLLSGENKSFIVSGKPGTGKTILAIYLIKFLKENEETKYMNVGLVIPMKSLRKTLKKVFKSIKGLKTSMIVNPSDASRNKYDILIVDESHRLKRRVNVTNFKSFDDTSKRFGLDPNTSSELDWIIKSSNKQIFFYDKNQSVRPSDVRPQDFVNLGAKYYDLKNQMRVEGGEEYIEFIDTIFDINTDYKYHVNKYEFKVFDDVKTMVDKIKILDSKHGISRVVAGYAWPWHTKNGEKDYDIEIGDIKLVWNSVAEDWINSKNSINEVGCIHTVQGYDLNYVGVIIGPELSYDPIENKLIVDKKKYFDINGKSSVHDIEELEGYIKNIYKTLLTRGIKGTFVYAVDNNLNKYLKDKIYSENKAVISPFNYFILPLYESVGCGDFMYANSEPVNTIKVDGKFISKGVKYFVLKVVGDSMNKSGINGGDMILCKKNNKLEDGKIMVVLAGDDAVVKKVYKDKNKLILKSNSTNPENKDLVFDSGDDVKIQGEFVRVLEK
jgi:DUF2075 family protein